MTNEELVAKYQETKDNKYLGQLHQQNLGLIARVAKRYSMQNSTAEEDLLQEAYFGIEKAADKFDASRGTKFMTYAVWWIRRLIQVASHDLPVVSVPRRTDKPASAVWGAYHSTMFGHPGKADQNNIAIHEYRVQSALSAGNQILAEEETATPLDEYCARETVTKVRQYAEAINLTDRQKEALLRNPDETTFQDIGDKYGISRQAVQLAEKHAKVKLKRYIEQKEAMALERRTA